MATSDDDEIERENSDAGQSVGSRLKAARAAQKLTLEEISAELKIAAPHLHALEIGDYAVLGAPVFAKGYLKQYGARLGLNVPELIAEYDRAGGLGLVEIEPSKTIVLTDARQITVWVVAAIVLTLIAAVIGFWWWLGSGRFENPGAITIEDEVAVPDLTANEMDPPPPESQSPQPEPVPRSSPAQTESTPGPSAAQSESEPAPASEQAEVPESAIQPASNGDPASLADAQAGAAARSGPELEIIFVADSWTEITADSGERLFYDLGRAGTIAMVPADRAMNLFFGNAAGILLNIDGEPLPIPATARRRGDTAQFDLGPSVDESDTDD